jgi:cytochrome c-type biogenesis protein CcmH/NrfG
MPMTTAIFLAAGAVALFTFLSIAAWSDARARERRTTERYALLRQLAEHPAESAQRVIDYLREEDARLEAEARQKAEKERQGSRGTGVILIATGIGLGVMVASLAPERNAWTVGLIPLLIGVAILFTGKRGTDEREGNAPRP